MTIIANQNQSKCSKRISTPIGILIIIVFAVIVGGVSYHYFTKEKIEIPKVKAPEVEAPKTEKPEETVQERIKVAVEKILSSPPPVGYEPIPSGVRILGVQVEDKKITINLSKELLSKGTGPVMEDAIHQILSPLTDVAPEIKNGEYRIFIEGVPLNEYLK